MYIFCINVESKYSHETIMELLSQRNNYPYCVITYTMKSAKILKMFLSNVL